MVEKELTIGIIGGKGKMGALFAGIFEKHGYKVIISDKKTKLSNSDICEKADVIIFSVPIDVTEKLINELAPRFKEHQLVMDFTSIKEAPINAMMKGASAVIGLHPMFNETSYGSGQKVIICPKRPKKWLPWLKKFLELNELKYHVLKPQVHDEMMSMVQGLVHFAEITFIGALKKMGKKVEKILPFSSPAYELKILLASRILAQDSNLYGNIQIQNQANLKALSLFLQTNEQLAEIVRAKDLYAFEKYFNSCAKYLGAYKNKALEESDWIIAQFLEKNRRMDKIKGDIHAEINQEEISGKKKSAIGVLGPELSYSDIVSRKWMQKNNMDLDDKKYFQDIPAVFAAVKKGTIKYGIVPIENSTQGTVRDTIDELFLNDLIITQELSLAIHHCLAAYHGATKKKIGAIMSHPQAISQCGRYLKKYFKKAEIIQFSSTAAAMKKLSEQKHPDIAVIGPMKAAKTYNLDILEENIEDNPNNKTRFIIISKPDKLKFAKNEHLKTSIAFHFSEDKPGSLLRVFELFANAKINLTHIESRPSKKEYGNYIFYVDFDGSVEDENVKKAIKIIKKFTADLKVFGSYPAA